MLYLQDKQPFERIEVTRDQALEIFSDNKFKASTLTLLFLTLVFLSFVLRNHIYMNYILHSLLFLTLVFLSFVLRNHIYMNYILNFRSPLINDTTISCPDCMAIVIRLKLSMICPLTRL
jgi:hypothetical protein